MHYTWEIIPTVSLNNIPFGSSRKFVHEKLGEPEKVIKKTPYSLNTTDVYSFCHIFYSVDDNVEAAEFFGNNIKLYISSQLLFPGTRASAKEIIHDFEECDRSMLSKSNSIGVGLDGNDIVSILIGCKNYYLR